MTPREAFKQLKKLLPVLPGEAVDLLLLIEHACAMADERRQPEQREMVGAVQIGWPLLELQAVQPKMPWET